jgi:hypothetical protein
MGEGKMSMREIPRVAALALALAMLSAVGGGAATFPYDGSYTGITAGTYILHDNCCAKPPCRKVMEAGGTFQFNVVKGIAIPIPPTQGSGTVSASGAVQFTSGPCTLTGTMTTYGGSGSGFCSDTGEKSTWLVLRIKKPHVATLDEVRITRAGDDVAIIEYLEPGISATNFRIGPEIQRMTDQEVLDLFNDSIRAREEDERANQPPPESN